MKMSRTTIILCCLAYVVMPIDLIPEFPLGPLGLADDLVVGLIGLRKLFQGEPSTRADDRGPRRATDLSATQG